MDLLKKCEDLLNRGEYRELFTVVSDVSEENLTPDLCLYMAISCLHLTEGWKGRVIYEFAIEALNLKGKSATKPDEWDYCMGSAYLGLEQTGRALKYFRKSQEENPSNPETEKSIQRCLNWLSHPHFTEPSLRRIDQAWSAFKEMEASVIKSMQDKSEGREPEEGSKTYADIGEAFSIAFHNFEHSGGLSADGQPILCFPLGEWYRFFEFFPAVNSAPEEILKKWIFYLGKQPDDGTKAEIDGLVFEHRDILTWLEEKEDGNKLYVYCEKLLSLYKDKADVNSLAIKQILLPDVVDRTIGELPRLKYCGPIKVINEPKQGSSIKLSELSDELTKKGCNLTLDPEFYLHDFEEYQSDAAKGAIPESEYGKLRSDITVGQTNFRDLILAYAKKDNDIADNLIADGAVPGFIFYAPPIETDESNEESQKYAEKLQEALLLGVKPNAITITGVGIGLVWWYLDFIAWDVEDVLRVAEEFFKKNPSVMCGFQTFHTDAECFLWSGMDYKSEEDKNDKEIPKENK